MKEIIDRNTEPVNKILLARTVLINKLLLTGTLRNIKVLQTFLAIYGARNCPYLAISWAGK